jgi:hypothetical protein
MCLSKKLIVLVLMDSGTFSFQSFEAQIDTGNMMQELLKQAVSNDILILNQQTVTSFVDKGGEVGWNDFSFRSKKVFFATNGFANGLNWGAVKPARAQVLITKPLKILISRELFIWIEAIIILGRPNIIGWWSGIRFRRRKYNRVLHKQKLCKNKLETLLKEVILPNQNLKLPIAGAESWASAIARTLSFPI